MDHIGQFRQYAPQTVLYAINLTNYIGMDVLLMPVNFNLLLCITVANFDYFHILTKRMLSLY